MHYESCIFEVLKYLLHEKSYELWNNCLRTPKRVSICNTNGLVLMNNHATQKI